MDKLCPTSLTEYQVNAPVTLVRVFCPVCGTSLYLYRITTSVPVAEKWVYPEHDDKRPETLELSPWIGVA